MRGGCHRTLLDRRGQPQDFIPIGTNVLDVERASDHRLQRIAGGIALRDVELGVAKIADARREEEAQEVHQREDVIGKPQRVGGVFLNADMPGLQPGQPDIGCAGARLGHPGQAQVNRIGQDRGQQQVLVPGHVTRFQMREMVGKTRTFVHLQQQFGDLDVRQDHRRLVDQGLRSVGHHRVEWGDLQFRLGDGGVGQFVG